MAVELYDVSAEETVIGLCLVDKAIWESAKPRLTARDFLTDRCQITWEELNRHGSGDAAIHDAKERLHQAFSVQGRLYFYANEWLPKLIARAEEVNDLGKDWVALIMERNLGIVLYLAKMRELIYQADRMQRMAQKPGVDLDATISDAIQRLSRFLSNPPGGITSRPEYQGEM